MKMPNTRFNLTEESYNWLKNWTVYDDGKYTKDKCLNKLLDERAFLVIPEKKITKKTGGRKHYFINKNCAFSPFLRKETLERFNQRAKDCDMSKSDLLEALIVTYRTLEHVLG